MVKRKMMERLRSLTISLCQMKVTPGKPDINAAYIIDEIKKAKKRGIDIVVFPEMCLTGYIVGDVFEDDYFIDDVLYWNTKIVEATHGIIVVFGTVTISAGKKGEDGRRRKHNAVVVAQNGKVLLASSKTLQPDYRFFNDDKYFFAKRKISQEERKDLRKMLRPVAVQTSIGKILLGAIICEDMWHEDYFANPTQILVKNGAQLVINVSASPWGWQKNRKRHQIVKKLLAKCHVPFVYVNNTGSQNIGKNIFVFDGSSAVYDEMGEIVFEIPPYESGYRDFTFKDGLEPLETKLKNDTAELYAAMVCATKSMVPDGKKVLVGLSGGIDSAVVCALLADVLGKERVIAVNMPMSGLNSQETRDMAQIIASNLGVEYRIVPITEAVETISQLTDIETGTLAHENIQARTRGGGAILPALAQKIGAWYACCSNKTEIAFGYGTLYGDIAGAFIPLGDLVKREVRQIADHLNREVFKREVIPERCINQIPTAELKPGQKDPFDYGDLNKRGYHDEMVRAITEFRKNPEWFLELYLQKRLEKEMKLEPGTLSRLFPAAKDFVNDLRHWWQAFHESYFKRIQCPPIFVFSKRAFGRDLEESLMKVHFTQRYEYLEKRLLATGKRKIVVLGGSFNPPGLHHKLIAQALAKIFDLVIVVPCGYRTDKTSMLTSATQRKEMVTLTFGCMDRVELDFYDIANDEFTPTFLMMERYQKLFPDSEVWFAMGNDLLAEIQTSWQKGREIWQNLKFAVVCPENQIPDAKDLPPMCQVLAIKNLVGRSTIIRKLLSSGESIDGLVVPEVAEYIKREILYKRS